MNTTRPIMVTHLFVLLLNLSEAQDVYGPVRLQRNSLTNRGGIEIYYHHERTWNPLCGNCWSNNSANVACRELGFGGGVRQNVPLHEHGTGIRTDVFECFTGDEANISSCHHYSTPCNPCTEVAGVICIGATRLVDYSVPDNIKVVLLLLEDTTGALEWNFLWGDHWTAKNANVTCKELGHSSGKPRPVNPEGQYVWERQYRCRGSESELRLCFSSNMLCSTCQILAAVQCAVDGSWSQWGSFGRCSVTCGEGEKIRKRACNNPVPQYGGLPCYGHEIDVQPCTQKKCPIDGHWSEWGSYGRCSVTCGDGEQIRKRVCDNPAPQYDGLVCDGADKSSQLCTEKQCPKAWNESCSTDSDCADKLVCKESGTCGCTRETDVWDRTYLRCQSSLEFRAIYSQNRMDFASAIEFCTLNMTGFLATRGYMNNMFISCMDPSNVIWLAETMTTANTYFGDNEMALCRTGRVGEDSEIFVTEVSCSEIQDFVCVVNRTHLSSVSNEPACSGFTSILINTDTVGITLGTIVAVVAACVLVIIAAAVIIICIRNRYSKGEATGGSTPEIQVNYNREASNATVGRMPNTDNNSQMAVAPSVGIDDYGYGVLGKPSRPSGNSVGMCDENTYSHTKSGQPIDDEYDVFVRRKENLDESGIYDHTGNGMMQDDYDVFQGPKMSYMENDYSLYVVDTHELP